MVPEDIYYASKFAILEMIRRQLEFQGYNLKDIQKEVNRRLACPNRHGW
jgi:hypothetical protein